MKKKIIDEKSIDKKIIDKKVIGVLLCLALLVQTVFPAWAGELVLLEDTGNENAAVTEISETENMGEETWTDELIVDEGMETFSDMIAEGGSQTETEADEGTDILETVPEPETDPEAGAETEAGTKPEAGAETEFGTESEAGAEIEFGTESETEAESASESEAAPEVLLGLESDMVSDPEGLIEDVSDAAEAVEFETEVIELKDSTMVPDRTPDGMMVFGLQEYNGCFGNQLEGFARKLYETREHYYAENLNTGNLVLTFGRADSPITFTGSVMTDSEGKQTFDTNSDEYQEFRRQVIFSMQSAADAFIYDHPEIFWFRGGSYKFSVGRMKTDGDTAEGWLAGITYTPDEAFAGAYSLISAYRQAVPGVISKIRNGADYNGDGQTDTLELIRAAHDYLCSRLYYDHETYDSGAYKEKNDYRIFCTAGAFLDSVGTGVVCEGYAKAFKVICDQLGIANVCIGGKVVQNGVTEGHMWNGVQVGGKWYLTDVTWDDIASGISYNYFMVGNITSNRTASGNFGGAEPGYSTIFTYPNLEEAQPGDCDRWDHMVTGTVTAPTCTAKGYTTYVCSRCHYTYRAKETPALGHDYQTAVTAPSCTAKGYATYACSRCNHTYRGNETPALGHDYRAVVTATCTAAGQTVYTCIRCGSSYTMQTGALGHSFSNGKCSRCGRCDTIAHASISSIGKQYYTGKSIKPAVTVRFGSNVLKKNVDYKVTYSNNKKLGTASAAITGIGAYQGTRKVSFKIVKRPVSTLKYSSVPDRTYTGKAQKPGLTVKNGSARLRLNKDYTISYAKNKQVGTAVITVKGKGIYTGTQKIYFKINPQKVSLRKLVSGSRGKISAYWNKISGTSGYQIQYSTEKSFKNAKTVTVKSGSSGKTISGLKKGKTYYVRMRRYRKVSGQKYYSGWSGKKKIKVKK